MRPEHARHEAELHRPRPWMPGAASDRPPSLREPLVRAAWRDPARTSGSAIGVCRPWRDLGYVVGALLAGALADAFGMRRSIAVIGVVTLVSGAVVAARMPEMLENADST